MTKREDPNRRFYSNMLAVLAIAGVIWLGVSFVNYRQTGRYDWSGAGVILLVIAALFMARSYRAR